MIQRDKRFICLLGIVFLFLLFRGGNLWAQEEEARSAKPSMQISDIAIPKSLGKIQDRYVGTSERWVIYIQDVHAHLTAQENIAAIVDLLNDNYGIQTVALEGNWSSTSYPKTWAHPATREKQRLTRALLEEDYITGPAYAAMFSKTPILLVGIENPELYQKNRQTYLDHLARREQIQSKIQALGNQIEEKKQSVFNPELLEFDQALAEFREGKKAEKFLPALMAQAENKAVDLADLDQIVLFKEALQKEKSLVKLKLDAEAKRLVEAYKTTGLRFEELLKSGKVPAEQLDRYPESKKYLSLMEVQEQIEHTKFFEQIEEAVERLKEELFISEEEKALDAEAERFYLAKKILLFQATPPDLDAYEEQKEAMDMDLEKAGLREARDLALNFYEMAEERDDVFFEKITADPQLQDNIAIVTGGFHTEGLSEHLKEMDISYLVISPELNNEPANEALYFQRLQENIQTATLSELNNRIDSHQDRVIKDTLLAVERGTIQDIREAVEIVARGQIISRVKVKAIPEGDFGALSPEEQEKAVEAVFVQIREGKQVVMLMMKTEALNKLLEKEAGEEIIEQILSNPSNKMTLLFESYIEIPEAVTGKGNVSLIPLTDIDKALTQRKPREAAAKKLLAIIDSEYENPNVLVLKESVVSLLLYRTLLEAGWKYSYEDSRTQELIQNILASLLAKQAREIAA
jgi:hypothetical protein